MELFAHAGVDHATTTEALGHILSTYSITILLILGAIITAALGLQQLAKATSKVSTNNNERGKNYGNRL